MKAVFMGTPDFAVPSLKALVNSDHEIIGVVTQPDRPRGRGKKVMPSPVKEEAVALGLPVYQPERVKEESFVELLKNLGPHVIAVAAFGQILPESVLTIPTLGCINVHSSLLPKYRGAAPMQRAIMNGDSETGITIMKMEKGLDSGDILLQSGIKIAGEDTFGTVHDRLAELGSAMLVETLDLLEAGKIAGVPQDHERATYAPMITREDEIIYWNKEVKVISNLVRALNPLPGARTMLGDRVLKVWNVSRLDKGYQAGSERPVLGEVLGAAGGGLAVQCGDGPAVILELQLQGGKRLKAQDFLRGYSVDPGTVLG
ncbi:MAG: methionyl-tRNA formyltransferase [Bacillota bacterium]